MYRKDCSMKVICKNSSGYALTEGKGYEVVELVPKLITTNFTFPRYVSVVDDNGKESMGHAYRFEMLDGVCCEEYIKENIKDEVSK